MGGRHFWYTRYRVPPLPSSGITECLHRFPSTFERLSIPVVRLLLTYSIGKKIVCRFQSLSIKVDGKAQNIVIIGKSCFSLVIVASKIVM